MREFSLIVVVVISIVGIFIMVTSPADREVWNLNDTPKAKDPDSDIDNIMRDIFPKWTSAAPYIFDFYENARGAVVEGTVYVDTARFLGLNDEFAKVIGKEKAITRDDVINTFGLFPSQLIPDRVSEAVDRIGEAISDGLTTARDIVTETLQRLGLTEAGPADLKRINLTTQEAIYAVMIGFLLNGYRSNSFEEVKSE